MTRREPSNPRFSTLRFQFSIVVLRVESNLEHAPALRRERGDFVLDQYQKWHLSFLDLFFPISCRKSDFSPERNAQDMFFSIQYLCSRCFHYPFLICVDMCPYKKSSYDSPVTLFSVSFCLKKFEKIVRFFFVLPVDDHGLRRVE